MPAPPPPPPMASAAPPPLLFKAPKSSCGGGANDRDALLKSIKKGAKLKKTVTNDRSAPMIAGSSSNNAVGNRNVNNNDNSTDAAVSPMKNFSSIHVQLKKQLGHNGSNLNNSDSSSDNVVSPMKNFSSIQMELKKQLANNDSRNRGPPPPAPNRNVSDTNFQRQHYHVREHSSPNGIHLSQLSLNTGTNNLQVNPSTLHRKAKSNANLSTLEINDDINSIHQSKPVINHGKPNLAPKPPVLNGKPSIAPLIRPPSSATRPALNRAHSMKSPAPRTPEPRTLEAVNAAVKFGTVRHMSNVLGQSLTLSGVQPQGANRQRPAVNGRPTAPPPKVPQHPPPYFSSQQPPPLPSTPPPPPSKTSVKHPNQAPPPPPPVSTIPQSIALMLPQAPQAPPPPPPHKTGSQQRQLPPSPLASSPINNNINPPAPPPRHSSMRENSSISVDLDEKFKHLFKSSDKFPPPPPYKNVHKVYSYNHKPVQKPGYVV